MGSVEGQKNTDSQKRGLQQQLRAKGCISENLRQGQSSQKACLEAPPRRFSWTQALTPVARTLTAAWTHLKRSTST